MKKFIAAVAVLSLCATSAIAAGSTNTEGALPAGKPAGVNQAQGLLNNTPLLVLGGIAVIVGVVLATNDNDSTATTATST